MTNLFKRFFTHKSKFLLIILCLLGMVLSYSCTCRNPNNPDDGTPDGGSSKKFSASVTGNTQNTLRVNSESKKKDGTEDIKISFSAVKGVKKIENFIVTIENVEVKDGGLDLGSTPDEYKTYMSYDKDTGTLRFENAGYQKIGALDSKDNPVDKTVSITFKIDGDEEGSDYITNDFHLIKIKKIDSNNIQDILRKGQDIKETVGSGPNREDTTFKTTEGTFAEVGKVFTSKNGADDKLKSITKSNIKDFIIYALEKEYGATSGGSMVENSEEGGGENDNYYSVKYSFTYGDNYESDLTEIKYRFEAQNGGKFK